MLKIIKLSTMLNEVENIKKEKPDKFKCYKCQCTDIDKLYLLYISKPKDDGTSEYISDCYCEDCCPFDMLTKFANTYYLHDECIQHTSQIAKIMQISDFSESEIVRYLLEI